MLRNSADSQRWVAEGSRLFLDAVDGLGEAELLDSTSLPGWTRRHLVAHVAANADALGNLVHWAETGIETPMYRSKDERAAGIERGVGLSTSTLRSWLTSSAQALDEAMTRLTGEQWERTVLTAQGRTVPATEIPWMRAREVCVHVVDLKVGVTFADLPVGFNAALCEDIRIKRGMTELPAAVLDAPHEQVTAWLAGRKHSIEQAPDIGPWL